MYTAWFHNSFCAFAPAAHINAWRKGESAGPVLLFFPQRPLSLCAGFFSDIVLAQGADTNQPKKVRAQTGIDGSQFIACSTLHRARRAPAAWDAKHKNKYPLRLDLAQRTQKVTLHHLRMEPSFDKAVLFQAGHIAHSLILALTFPKMPAF